VSQHLQRQITKLKKQILQVGTMVEEAVRDAIQAVHSRDVDLARRTIQGDTQINEMEIDVEEECLHTLALHQPVAQDLRYVVAVLKINNDLERIADLAVNVAKQAILLSEEPKIDALPYDLPGMAKKVKTMLEQSLDALVNSDTELAESVREMDDDVDAIHRQMYRDVEQRLQQDPDHARQLIHLLGVSRSLERIADHTVNIAEDVLYMAKGGIYRHGHQPQVNRPKA